MATQADYLAGIAQRIQDEESRLDSPTLLACLEQGVQEYSIRRPQQDVEDVVADGTAFLAVPSGWESTSRILRIDQLNSSSEPCLVNHNLYRVIDRPSPDAPLIYFAATNPSNGVSYRITYTILHTVTVTASSIPLRDEESVQDVCASFAALRLAAFYKNIIDQNIMTETINFQTKFDQNVRLAEELRKQFDINVPFGRTASGMKALVRRSPLLLHG
jgi:hypothetical protein